MQDVLVSPGPGLFWGLVLPSFPDTLSHRTAAAQPIRPARHNLNPGFVPHLSRIDIFLCGFNLSLRVGI